MFAMRRFLCQSGMSSRGGIAESIRGPVADTRTNVGSAKRGTRARWRRQSTSSESSANRLGSLTQDVQPGGTGPTRLRLIVPDDPLLLPPVKV